MPSAATTEEVSDREVEKFVATQIAMADLQTSLQTKVREGGDPDEAQQAYQQGAAQALEKTGLSVARYEAIAQRVSSDPNLRARVQKQVASAVARQ